MYELQGKTPLSVHILNFHQHFPAGRLDEPDAEHVEIRQSHPGRAVEIDADEERLQIEAEIDVLDRAASHHGHRTALVLAGIAAGADPLEKSLPAVDFDVEKGPGQSVHGPLAAPADRPGQFRRRRITQDQVDVLQVLAKQVIERFVLSAGVVVAEPPTPIASLSDVNLLPGLTDAVGIAV